ncbi:MAG TPA: twin-arginine translocase TatA/TatE family subunit [Candidatus Polarisedimenticolia bacterium]|nr:twin-arginine translocase TatA/TatE family subunit [Candidatus Polarisedimenticolia bacterium]
MGKIGATEWLVILAILLLLFGAAKLPAIGKGLGEGIRNFKKALKNGSEDEPKEPDEKAGNKSR